MADLMRLAVGTVRRAFVYSFAVAVLGLCASCAHVAPAHQLTVADGSGDVSSLNPHLTMGATIDDIGQLALAYFMRYDRAGRLTPELITAIPSRANGGVSRDGLNITWHLRRGVRWSDGAPFSARDVAFTIRAILNPRNAEVDGTEGWNEIRRVDTPDPYTVIYRLKEPYGALIPMSFVPVGGGPCVLPEHVLGHLASIDQAAYNSDPVGIGPFRIKAWHRGDSIDFVANPYYWRGRPRLQRVVYKLLASNGTVVAQMRTGDVELWPLVPPSYVGQLRPVPNLRIATEPSLRTTHLDFMMSSHALADTAVRRAIRLAINRRLLVHNVEAGNGLLSDDIVWPLRPVTRDDPAAVAYDPALARRVLTQDGWRTSSSGIRAKAGERLRFELVYQTGAPDLNELVELIRADLRAVGVGLDTRTYTHTLLFAPQSDGGILAQGKFDIALYSSTIVSLPDLASNFDCAMAPPAGENYTHWCDPHVPAILRTMRRNYDEKVTLAAFLRLDHIFVQDVPSIQLYVWKSSYAVNRRVTNYRPNILTSFDDMMNVDVRH